MKNKKTDLLYARLTLIAGILLFIAILYFSSSAIVKLGENYHLLKNADLSKDTRGTVYYDDHIYGMIGFGIEILSQESNKAERLSSFLRSSLGQIDKRILSCLLVYTTMTAAVMTYFLYCRFRDDRKKRTVSAILSVILLYSLYLLGILLPHLFGQIPFYLPGLKDIALLFIGLLSIIAGECSLLFLIEKIPFKKTVSLIAVPLILLLFMISSVFEYGLYTLAYEESFAYIAEIDERILDENFAGEFYYDDERNVMILEGKEYPPEVIENEEYYRGFKRIGAYLFEAVNPYSGNGLGLVLGSESLTDVEENSISLWQLLFYVLKDAFWILVGFKSRKHFK